MPTHQLHDSRQKECYLRAILPFAGPRTGSLLSDKANGHGGGLFWVAMEVSQMHIQGGRQTENLSKVFGTNVTREVTCWAMRRQE